MSNAHQPNDIRVTFTENTVDIFSGSGMETKHLAHLTTVQQQIPNALVSFVFIAGKILPMHVRLFNHTDRLCLGETAIYHQLVDKVNSTTLITHKLSILQTITEPLTLHTQGRYAVVSSGEKRLLSFSLDPTPSDCTYNIPGQEGLYHVLSTFVDKNNPDRATRDTMIKSMLELLEADTILPCSISPVMRPVTLESRQFH